MYMPTIRGVIERRVLVNYRVDPQYLARVLPSPFRPQLVESYGVGGICLIRLGQLRPKTLPAALGLRSENAAHRIAVEWTESGQDQTGVYVLRRDTDSRLNVLAGGRFFPGRHYRARFTVGEQSGMFSVRVSNARGVVMAVESRLSDKLPSSSVFKSLEHASEFFRQGAMGYSPARIPGAFDVLELRSHAWRLEPLEVSRIESSFFDDQARFPAGTVQFDCAILMRNVQHEWHSHATLRAPEAVA